MFRIVLSITDKEAGKKGVRWKGKIWGVLVVVVVWWWWFGGRGGTEGGRLGRLFCSGGEAFFFSLSVAAAPFPPGLLLDQRLCR